MSLKLSRMTVNLVTATVGVALSLAAILALVGPAGLPDLIGAEVMPGVIEYALWAGLFFVVFWVVLNRWMGRRKLARKRWPARSQILREVMFSLCSQFVFLAVAFSIAFMESIGAGNMYLELSAWDLLYIPLVTFLILALDDTYFYWTHRMLHHPLLFERAHRVHHESVDPTPFSAFSFHPLEAIILGIGALSILPVVALMPWHPIALIAAGTFSIMFNVIGHLGYEVYPKGWNRVPLLRWKTPGYHHYMHHQRVGGNYALYFRWWDLFCGTEFNDYEKRYDALFSDPPGPARVDRG